MKVCFGHATILIPSFLGLGTMTPFCVLNTKINALQIRTLAACANETTNVYVVVNFYFSIVFGTVIYANEFETKEKKNYLINCNICMSFLL